MSPAFMLAASDRSEHTAASWQQPLSEDDCPQGVGAHSPPDASLLVGREFKLSQSGRRCQCDYSGLMNIMHTPH